MSKGLNKEDALFQLKTDWNMLHDLSKKDLIYSLLGHRMKFVDIAHEIGQSVEAVKQAWKGLPNVVMVDDCGHSQGYQGLMAPTCAGGAGCKLCWAIYKSVQSIPLDGVASPKVLAVSPAKAMYSLSFDEILEKYRECIEWKQYHTAPVKAGLGPNDNEYLNGIIISDIHAPFHDEDAFATMIAQTKGTVDVCILGGDGGDFHNFSRFIKFGQHFSIKDEHKAFMAILATLSESYPEVIMIPGNHDERTRKKFAQLLPPDHYQVLLDMHGANTFDFAELMTRQFDNILVPACPTKGFAEYRFLYQVKDIVVGHPELFSKIPNRSVGNFIDWLKKKAEPEGLVKPFSAVVMGHTHQAGKTFNDYGIIGIENSCLCMTPDYDANPKLSGAPRPTSHGYTRFRTNKLTGKTNPNDINLIYV